MTVLIIKDESAPKRLGDTRYLPDAMFIETNLEDAADTTLFLRST
jgi:hypothetical protein